MAPARLVYKRQDGSQVTLPLTGEVMTVGRDEGASLRVDEPLVSKLHARIERRGGSFFVLDLGSTNLTRVNGEVVAERELQDGDEIRFARACCVFHAPGAADPVTQGV